MMRNWLAGFFGDKERWSVNCDYHNWTVHDLSFEQAHAVLSTLRDTEKASVMVWKTGWRDWKNLRDPECADLLLDRVVRVEAPPVPNKEDFDPEITAVRSLAPNNPFASRKLPRFGVNYPVVILSSSNQEFVTETIDLSLGGMKLKDSLPDWVAGYCTVVLEVEDGQTFELMCSLAEDQKFEKNRLEITPSERLPAFQEWFQNHPSFQEQ